MNESSRHVNGRTRVKVCGITREQDLAAAIAAGVDSVGLVFYPKSKRHLSLTQATELVEKIPAFVSVVALFLNPQQAEVEQVIDAIAPEILQFHGDESAAFCEQFGRRYIKGVAMGGSGSANASEYLQAARAAHPKCSGFLLDGHAPGEMGGSGLAFDWSNAPRASIPLIVAGGLTPDNVASAIAQMHPWAVDVSSGVEDAPGIKSAVKIHAFLAAVRAADQQTAVETGR